VTSRERIQRVIDHEKPDRVPTVIHARGEMQRALMDHYAVDSFEAVEQILGAERYREVGLDILFPGYEDKTNKVLVGDCPWSGQKLAFHDERTFEDGWGVIRRVGRDGKYVEWIDGPLAGVEDIDEYDFPGADRIIDNPQLPQKVSTYKQQGLYVRAIVANPYKQAWYLRGMENLLTDYLINRPFIEALYDRIYNLFGEILRRCTKAGVDMIGVEGDIAMQDRIIMGPDSWREIDKPRLAEMIRSCKDINPDVRVFIHSDGDLRALFPDLIEIGFDVIDSIQPECMDPFELKRLYGDRITLHGCGSLQHTLPFGTPDDCREEVKNLIEGCGKNGGLILRPSNMIGWDIPLDNLIAWYESARDYDLSPL